MQKLDYAKKSNHRSWAFDPQATVAPYALALGIFGVCFALTLPLLIAARLSGPLNGILIFAATIPYIGIFFSVGGLCLEHQGRSICLLSFVLNVIAIGCMWLLPMFLRA